MFSTTNVGAAVDPKKVRSEPTATILFKKSMRFDAIVTPLTGFVIFKKRNDLLHAIFRNGSKVFVYPFACNWLSHYSQKSATN